MNLKTEICNTFNKCAAEYEKAAIVQCEIGTRLFERLDYLKINPKFVLDLGSGTGFFSLMLKKRYPKAQIVGFDLAFSMLKESKKKQGFLKKWHLINGDMAHLPFASGVFDLVFSNQTMHWSSPLSAVLQELNRVMHNDSCLMFTMPGPDTFKELKKAWLSVDAHAHANEFLDMHDIGDALLNERFLDPVVDMELLTVHYPSINQLLQSVKAQGVRNINPNRNRGLTGAKALQSFKRAYPCTPGGKYPLTYEVVYGHAFKGASRRLENGTETYISVSEIGRMKRP
ncbi:MAG: malonyl-ACP O-methyltransferase BioC [Tatlockia sp.]|jgi:malonyl-CoA O-methyltransferase